MLATRSHSPLPATTFCCLSEIYASLTSYPPDPQSPVMAERWRGPHPLDRLSYRPTHDSAAVQSRPGPLTPAPQPGRRQHAPRRLRRLAPSRWHKEIGLPALACARTSTAHCNTPVRLPLHSTPFRCAPSCSSAPSLCPAPTLPGHSESPAHTPLSGLQIQLG